MESFSVVSFTGSYQFKIDYSKTKDIGAGKFVKSPTFRVAQHDWAIKYFPKDSGSGNHISIYLGLQRKSEDVTAAFDFVLMDNQGNVSPTTLKKTSHTFTPRKIEWGFVSFLEITKLEESHVKDGCFILRVSVTVNDDSCKEYVHHDHFTQSAHNLGMVSDVCKVSSMGFLHECIQMFREKDIQTDVSFVVDGKIFVAHRLILAAQSPVFEAELFGSMAESKQDHITINEMMPSIFKAMIDFMYSGSLTVNEDLNDSEEPMSLRCFFQNLLMAADRYAVEKLKSLCEEKLVGSLSLDNVLSLLELAENHNCSALKIGCLKFIVDKDILVALVLTEEYIEMVQKYPFLLAELKEMASKCAKNGEGSTSSELSNCRDERVNGLRGLVRKWQRNMRRSPK